jgi:hypothetical protein
MTDFVVTITDPEQLAGITWAREQHNASLPPPPPDVLQPLEGDDEGDEPIDRIVVENPPQTQAEGAIATDEEYVQWVMEQASASYAVQQEQAQWRQAYEDAQAESRAKSRMRSG